ncbi:MAG: RNA methyltransferase [Acidobacteria bacterium]|nr:RNA methyltransferase [Acidobacteriota bacterium]
MKTISSRQNPIVRRFRELARTPDSSGARLLLDGVHLVRDARAAGIEIEVAAIAASRSRDASEEADLARALAADGALVHTVSDHAFLAMSPVRTPSGLLAIVRRTPADADHICRRADAFVLVAIDVQDPGNLGSLVRAGEAGGATGVLVCGTSASPFSWKAVRGSMGSMLRLPVAAGLSADDAIRCMRRHRGRVVAGAPRGGRPPDTIDWRRPVALLLGGEGPGLSDATLAQADDLVTIPMTPPVESLNVAVAAAILVYAARRQRVV